MVMLETFYRINRGEDLRLGAKAS
ncbi:MAG: hypothetical protein JWP16_2396, partial [Alphaproteobacteria bacterium]|nr:hypothetical protein [Alphaproteobacteria bacterium]